MTPQLTAPAQPPVTMFLKPAFAVTAQGSGLQVAVTLQLPLARPDVRN